MNAPRPASARVAWVGHAAKSRRMLWPPSAAEKGKAMRQSETGTHITCVGTVGIPVADQDRALEFYVGRLGFEKRMDMAYGQGQRWVEVAPSGAVMSK